MHQTSCSINATGQHPDDAPFADERNRYLRHCAEHGATGAALKVKRNELRWIATRLGPNAHDGVDMAVLSRIAEERKGLHGAATAVGRVIYTGRPWLRFLGWWRDSSVALKYQVELDQYVDWMRNERGFTPETVKVWGQTIARFLRWCEQGNHALSGLGARDVDAYFASPDMGRRCRVSVANTAVALRGFLRFAASRSICTNSLAAAVCSPRLYQHESLPYAPDWSDVQRMLADVDTDRPRDIRDRAIMLLLAVYGMRSSEVCTLRLDQVDWAGRTLRLFRLKRRQPQDYPLAPSVAEGLARYIDLVRPSSSLPQVFLCTNAPRRPMDRSTIHFVVKRRFVALEIQIAHRGGHALRHACARRLLAERLSLKEIGDHLGHRSASAASIYAKVDMNALRQVAAFDLGDLP